MSDREKVIKGLQIERECVSRDCDRDCGKCDLVQDRDWLLSVYDDALALLKEQEPKSVKVVKTAYDHELYYCPRCDRPFCDLYYVKPKFCDKCGQAVKWNV